MKKFWRSTTMTVVLFLLALGLLSVGAIGGTQAALNIKSNNYYSAFDLDHIGVALYNGGADPVAWRTFTDDVPETTDEALSVSLDGNLSATLEAGEKEIKIGKQYPMPITVANTGTIDQYVRVTIRKYWVDNATGVEAKGWFHGEGSKNTNAAYLHRYIQLGYNGGTNNFNSSSWYLDESASTPERQVYYYKGILPSGDPDNPGKNITAPLIDCISISPEVTKDAVVTTTTVTTAGGVTKTKSVYTYAYNGLGFVVRAEVDAIQTHHARAAMTSAWGTSSAVMTAIGVPNEA